MGNHVFHAAVFANEQGGVLLANARDAWDVVGRVAPKPQDINHLPGFGNAVFLADVLGSEHLCRSAEFGRFVDQDLVGDQLTEILVGRHHVSNETFFFSFVRQGADDIVRLIALGCVDRNVETLDKPDDIGNRSPEVVGHGFAVGFILTEFLCPHRRAMKVEGHPDMSGLFVAEHVVQSVQKPHHRGGVQAF